MSTATPFRLSICIFRGCSKANGLRLLSSGLQVGHKTEAEALDALSRFQEAAGHMIQGDACSTVYGHWAIISEEKLKVIHCGAIFSQVAFSAPIRKGSR